MNLLDLKDAMNNYLSYMGKSTLIDLKKNEPHFNKGHVSGLVYAFKDEKIACAISIILRNSLSFQTQKNHVDLRFFTLNNEHSRRKVYLVPLSEGNKIKPEVLEMLKEKVNDYMKNFIFQWEEVPLDRVGQPENQNFCNYVRKEVGDEEKLLSIIFKKYDQRNNSKFGGTPFLINIKWEKGHISISGSREQITEFFTAMVSDFFSQPQSLKELSAQCIKAHPELHEDKSLPEDIRQLILNKRNRS